MAAKSWLTPFETPGRSGRVAVQRAGGNPGCPVPSIYPCECGRTPAPQTYEIPEHANDCA